MYDFTDNLSYQEILEIQFQILRETSKSVMYNLLDDFESLLNKPEDNIFYSKIDENEQDH